MIRSDYILRIIEQVGKLLAKVLLDKESGNHEEAVSEIENAFKNLLGVDPALLNVLPVTAIAELLGNSTHNSTGIMKCIIAGQLLKEKADVLRDVDAMESLKQYHNALGLYLQGFKNMKYSEIDMTRYISDVKGIEKNLTGNLLAEERDLLSEFHEKY